ncbi:hypothetical protein H5410_001527, partial [Solanum commersonii]
MRWKKSTSMMYRDMYNSGDYGTKINRLGFRWVQPKVIIPFGFHNSKIITRVYKKIKNKRLYQELCTKEYENALASRIAKPYGNPNILVEFIAGQLKNRNKRIQKEFKYKLRGVSTEKKLHVSNGSEKAGFPYKRFKLKLIIALI